MPRFLAIARASLVHLLIRLRSSSGHAGAGVVLSVPGGHKELKRW
ncbi:hypothetical protein [Kordiimonas sediminis]|nr:hypothetical protein [Kordiimonas sediminis]